MILQEVIKYLNFVMFGFFSYVYFFRLLGVKKNAKVALITIVLYLIFFDYLFLGKIVYNILKEQFPSGLKYYLIYFFQITVSQICFTAIISALFKGDILKKIAVSTIYFVVCELVEYGVSPIFQRTLDLIVEHTKTEISPLIFTFISVLTYIITCILLHIISKFCKNLRSNLPKKILVLLCIPSLFILLMLEFVILICDKIQVFHMLYISELTSNFPLFYQTIDIAIIFVMAVMGLSANLIIVLG